jgi:hypothetical protein
LENRYEKERVIPIDYFFIIRGKRFFFRVASTKTAAESPVRKGGGEWRVVFVGVQGACPRGF